MKILIQRALVPWEALLLSDSPDDPQATAVPVCTFPAPSKYQRWASSGMSMHLVEHIIYQGSVQIHFVIPANPLRITYHFQHYTLTAATTHSGYECLLVDGKKAVRARYFSSPDVPSFF